MVYASVSSRIEGGQRLKSNRTTETELKPLNMVKLRRDMQIIMDEIDCSGGVLPDAYSPLMWQRLQETTEKIADAIQAVRLTLSGMRCAEAAAKLGLETAQVAGYVAWNTMLQPDWVAPRIIIAETACPKCGAAAGERCNYSSAPPHKIHKERREAHKAVAAGKQKQ
jgi:hypothetical protein